MTSAEALAHLGIFTGKWLTTGRQHAGAAGPDARITVVETYEWLQGDKFLIHRFDGQVGDQTAACVEIIGRDAASEDYSVQTFYSNGMTNDWRLHERDQAWLLTGKWNMEGKKKDVRCTMVFSDDGSVMAARWAHSTGESPTGESPIGKHPVNGEAWHTFWEVEARKQI